jgi:hypothetical protein
MTKPTSSSRRDFLKVAGTASIAFPTVITSNALGANGALPASERITVAALGCGGRAGAVISEFLRKKEAQVIAVNDVRKGAAQGKCNQVNRAYGNNDCRIYEDYRDLLARDDIDMVYIGTPDHWHAQMVIDACIAGKDVFCEKPLTLTIGEGRKIVDTARRYGRVAGGGSQRVLEDYGGGAILANNGRYGKVLVGNTNPGVAPYECHLGEETVPKDLNWDFWLGPAPWAPFHQRRFSGSYDIKGGKGWRSWSDYSGGGMTDWGGHKFGALLHGMKLDHTGPNKITPPRGNEPMIFHFASGQKIRVTNDASFYQGEGGNFGTPRHQNMKVPDGLRWYSGGSQSLVEDFLYSVRMRKRPFRDVEFSHRTASLCHLGNIALRLNRTLHWDPVKEDFVGDIEASTFVDRARRGPWQI